MRLSSSGAAVTAMPFCPTSAVRVKVSFPQPRMVWPALAPVRPGTGSPEAVYTASNCWKGPERVEVRRRVRSRPCHSSSSSPAMGAPDHGW